ncbi:uncharacterized protein LOC143546816 [Bidens hawaiensis]|uniref:uncharacterized protein LOC143546816 n=1 Tax=Bidens hawaiensis TaxID=980011 RepID=UPI00404AA151
MASSSEPPYLNGKRGPSLDRSERTFSSGFVVTRSGASALVAASGSLPTLSQCLSFEPIQIGDLGIDRSAELKRVMGIIAGSTSEENSSKNSSLLSVAEDLKRLRSSVVDTCNTARGRVSKLDDHLHKLDKYCDSVIVKKTQRNEFMANDKADALNLKIVNQRVEDRPKSVLLNKRVRTSVAETRAECRSNGLRRQPVVMTKDRDLLKENDGELDNLEEKIPKFPAGGEGWDKKMKRKRSVGTVSTRSMDSNGEPKRTAQDKAASEPVLQSNDTHSYRLGASNGTGTTHKMDNKLKGPSLPDSSRACESPRNELEGPTSSGSNKERILTKGNNKLNTRDDNNIPSGNLVTKIKASRTTRSGAMVAASSSPSTPHLTGTPESWEIVIGGAMNRKRATPLGPPSPGMAQWAGQRPQKMSRTRRSNLVPPVSNQEEKPLSSDSCSLSDGSVSVRLASDGTNDPLISKQLKPKQEPVQSPHRLNESEESVGGQSHGQNVGPSLAVEVKVKSIIIEESGKDVKRPLIAKASSTITGVKLDNTPIVNPIRSNTTGCEKNGSKSGRPLKKLSDRKGVSGVGQKNGGSDLTGKSDDREELMAAVNNARNATYLACSSTFWKKMEPIFAPVSSKDKVYLSTQLKEPDIQESFSQFNGRANNVVINFTHEVSIYNTNSSGERNMHVKHQGSESFSGRLDSDKTSKKFIPLFQRVLSALIIEDTINEIEEENTQIIPLQAPFYDSAYDRFQIDDFSEPRKRVKREVEHDTMFQSIHSVKVSFSSNGHTNSFNDSPCDDVALAGISKNLVNRPQVIQMEGFGIPSFDNQYDQMCLDDKVLLELRSIGLDPELVPKLDDKEDETIKQEINQLKTRLRQQNYKKKASLEQLCKSIGNSFVGRDLEQLAFDKLVEIAYKKFLATRGPSRGGTLKIPKHIAMAFGRRALARCRKFAKSGVSCFNVAPLRDILFAPQEVELFDDVNTAYQGERKIKVNPAGRTPTSGNGHGNQSTRSLHPVQPSLNGPNHNRDVDPLHDMDPIDELGVGGPQDLSSLLNFDDEELQDDFSAGLEIPMDDLTELNMF